MPLVPGLKLVLTAPVVASNANTWLRVSVVLLLAFCTWVKLPPTMTMLPTWTIEYVVPLRMLGVNPTGLSLTMRPVCGSVSPTVAAWPAGARPTPATTLDATSRTDSTNLRTTIT